jgi:hypothetical protein
VDRQTRKPARADAEVMRAFQEFQAFTGASGRP